MHPRKRLRLLTLPHLYKLGRKPSVAPTTTSEISDEMIGLRHDPVAQIRAEEAIRAALSYRVKQAEKAEAAMKARRPQIIIAAEELRIDLDTAEGIVRQLVRLSASPQTGTGFPAH